VLLLPSPLNIFEIINFVQKNELVVGLIEKKITVEFRLLEPQRKTKISPEKLRSLRIRSKISSHTIAKNRSIVPIDRAPCLLVY